MFSSSGDGKDAHYCRTATVTAMEEVEVLVLSRDQLASLLQSGYLNDQCMIELKEMSKMRQKQNESLSKIHFFFLIFCSKMNFLQNEDNEDNDVFIEAELLRGMYPEDDKLQILQTNPQTVTFTLQLSPATGGSHLSFVKINLELTCNKSRIFSSLFKNPMDTVDRVPIHLSYYLHLNLFHSCHQIKIEIHRQPS